MRLRAFRILTGWLAGGRAQKNRARGQRRHVGAERTIAEIVPDVRIAHGLNFFVFGGGGWERNTFAGFNDRYSFVAGIGDAFINDDRTLFKADIGGTYTIQQDVEPTPGKDEGFGGLRSNIEFKRALSETTDFETLLVADENLRDTEDLRFDWKSSLSVSLTDGLAFKTSYRMLFDNQPALISVPLFDAGSNPLDENVLVPSQKFDNFVTLSLVITL